MRDLSQKLDQKKKKPILRETTLTDNDLVNLSREHHTYGVLFLIKDGYLYRIKERLSEINHSNPKVSLKYRGNTAKFHRSNRAMSFLREFQPYREVRNSK